MKKMNLNRETLRNLDLREIRGGGNKPANVGGGPTTSCSELVTTIPMCDHICTETHHFEETV